MVSHVVNTAVIRCSCAMPPGTAPLAVLPLHRMLSSQQPAANIMDHKPMVNIPSFGMCASPSSPGVIAATSAAAGTFTPIPCIPKTVSPWTAGATTVILDQAPVLDDISVCPCLDGGTVSVVYAGQATEWVP